MKTTKWIALTLATACALGTAMPSFTAFAEEEDIILIEPSAYLADQTGSLTLHISGDRDLEILIEKNTNEGTLVYYNTFLEEDGTYQFLLDSCEYDYDAVEGGYISTYTVTIQDVYDYQCAYIAEDLIVYDTGREPFADGTAFDWTVTLEENAARNQTANLSEEEWNDENIISSTGDIQLQYISYLRGDVDGNGHIELNDAFLALMYYAKNAVGTAASFTNENSDSLAEQTAFSAADADEDSSITLNDAFLILLYYAQTAVGNSPSWNELISG